MQRCVERTGLCIGLALVIVMASSSLGCHGDGCHVPPGDYHAHFNPTPGNARYFSGGIETDDGYFDYLAFATSVQIGGYPPAVVGQRVMSNTSTAPTGDIPWIFLPDGWLYWTGDAGCIGTDVASTCAHGSTMIIQRNVTVNGKQCDRFMMHRTHLTDSGHVVVKNGGKIIPYLGRASSWIDVPYDGSAPMGPYAYDEDPKVSAQYRQPPGSEQVLKDIKQARKHNHVP
jgi:hypothetical protein